MALSKTQEKIFGYIRRYLNQHGYAPAVREIMVHCGFKSPRAVSYHLEKLQKAGAIRRDRKARSISPVEPDRVQNVPVLGTSEVVAVSQNSARQGAFGLRVHGSAMEGARIFDGDIALVELRTPRVGDIVAASLGGQNSIRRFIKQKDKYFLKSEDPAHPEMLPADDVRIQGVVIGVYRRLA